MKSRNLLILGVSLIILLLFFYAPSTCNGVTYYRGYRGCGKDNSSTQRTNTTTDNKTHMFFNLLQF